MLELRVPEYDKAKRGRTIITLEWCFDGRGSTLGYIQVTPTTNGDLPLAHQIAALPLLIEVCEETAKEPYQDSDLGSLLETLRHRAQAALCLANKGDG